MIAKFFTGMGRIPLWLLFYHAVFCQARVSRLLFGGRPWGPEILLLFTGWGNIIKYIYALWL